MGEKSPQPATAPIGALFLSYASQEVEAARRICDSLRAAGIEVWFDQNELRGGDMWDQQIRHKIHDCALFVPIISHQTQQRLEGYFRHEWKLAVDRTHHMADQCLSCCRSSLMVRASGKLSSRTHSARFSGLDSREGKRLQPSSNGLNGSCRAPGRGSHLGILIQWERH
jgi:hypothetical protein